ncbi:hypothetical protein PTKIN_Ptkin17bG0027100 [Pterospermum kingtungense]
MKKGLIAVILVGILAGAIPGMVDAQCGNKCSATQCCSRFGYCGTDDAHCGVNCRAGPCKNNGVSVDSIVTPAFFNWILNRASCARKDFYSIDAFRGATNKFSQFGKIGTVDDSKREIAAFFAHASHETGGFCFIEEKDGASKNYCDKSKTEYPCKSSKGYYGRGPLQLTWNYNYGESGKDLGLDLLSTPETVANDKHISFKASLSFWMNNAAGVMKQGFGETIKAVNSLECKGAEPVKVANRVNLYKAYCQHLGVDPGPNLSC